MKRNQNYSNENQELPENFKTPIIKAAGKFEESSHSSGIQEVSNLHQVEERSESHENQHSARNIHNMSAQNQSTIEKYQHYSVDEP